MKVINKILIAIFFTLNFSSIYSQTYVYHPFVDTMIVWNESFDYGDWCGSSACVTQDYYQYFLGEEIEVAGNFYRKILQSGSREVYSLAPCSWCSNTTTYYVSEYSGSIRNDTLAKKVFYMPTSEDAEILLYDFSLNVGDFLPYSYTNMSSTNYISSIDSIQIGADYHKRLWISEQGGQTNYTSLIEGIGCDMGLLTNITPPFEAITNLNCVSINSIPVYPDTATYCAVITSVNHIPEKSNIVIFPDPFSTYASITLKTIDKGTVVEIYNVFGQRVKQLKAGSEKTIIIEREDLKAGIYFLQIKQEDKTFTAKFIISDAS